MFYFQFQGEKTLTRNALCRLHPLGSSVYRFVCSFPPFSILSIQKFICSSKNVSCALFIQFCVKKYQQFMQYDSLCLGNQRKENDRKTLDKLEKEKNAGCSEMFNTFESTSMWWRWNEKNRKIFSGANSIKTKITFILSCTHIWWYNAEVSEPIPLKDVMSHLHILKSPYFPLVCSTGIVKNSIISQNVHKSHDQWKYQRGKKNHYHELLSFFVSHFSFFVSVFAWMLSILFSA